MNALKRALDVTSSLAGLLVLSPALAVIAFTIRIADGSPVLFRQHRVGERGRLFTMYKFRTMTQASSGSELTVAGDSRITRVGAFLRRLKLDELPQLGNVLAGHMSLVGPRPEVPRYVQMYSEAQRRVLDLRPGISDPASIRYAHESTLLAQVDDPERYYIDVIMPDKIRINLDYAARATVLGDVGVVLATVSRMAAPARARVR